MVVITIDDAREAVDRVVETNKLARRAGEHFSHMERLRQEALDLARTRNGQLVFFRQFIHAQDGDDVLQ